MSRSRSRRSVPLPATCQSATRPLRRQFCQPRLEILEDRTLLDAGGNLTALLNAAGTVNGFASSLSSGPLSQDLPILSDGTAALGKILGVSSTFGTLSNALKGINVSQVLAASNRAAELQAELGSGFSVSQVDDTQVLVTYTLDVSGANPSVSAATTLTDFFGNNQASYYLSKIVSLSGSASGQFAAGSKFTLTIGADSNGFFVNPGTIFSSDDFSATLNLSGKVDVGQLGFDAAMTGTGKIDLKKLNLSITQKVSGPDLSNIGQKATFTIDTGSTASVTGDFKVSVLGFPLVDWGPTLTWGFNSNGGAQAASVSVPTSGTGAPMFLNQSSVQSALVDTLANSLGLNQFGIVLNPLTQAPAALQDIIGFMTQYLQGGLNDPSLDPQQGVDMAMNGGSFQFASASDLYNIVANGAAGNLLTYIQPNVNFLNLGVSPSLTIPGFSVLGIINFLFTAGVSFQFTGSAGLGVGVDTSGLFVDTSKTKVTFTAGAGADVGITVNVAGLVNLASASVGPVFTTSAVLGLNDTFNGTPQDGKVNLSELKAGLDQSQSLPSLGSWLANALQLKTTVNGKIELKVQVNTPVGGLIDALPGPVGDALKPVAQGIQDVEDFLSGAVEQVCETVESIPVIGGLVKKVVNCQDVRKVAQITFGDYLVILDKVAQSLNVTTIQHINGGQSAIYTWDFPIVNFMQTFNGPGQISAGGSSESNPSTSDPSDFIQYQVSGSTLTITGQAGKDNVRILDLGGGKIELLRSGFDTNNVAHSDPARVFSGITQINANLVGDNGDSFLMDATVMANANVTGGAGDDTIITGAGNDTIHGGAGKDNLQGGSGTNYLYGEGGNDTLAGGSGIDYLYGGADEDELVAGSGTEYLDGGTGNDILNAGGGTDTLHGGGGKDTFRGGSGTATMYGEGGVNDTDNFFGGSGPATMYGGQGTNNYTCGTGTAIVYGGSGLDTITWQVGDGNASVDGGINISSDTVDLLQLFDSSGPDSFTVGQSGSAATITAPGATLTATHIQILNLDGKGGADKMVVNDLTATSLLAVGINLGEIAHPDGTLDQTTINGPSGSRPVNITEGTGTASDMVTTGPVLEVTGLGPTFVMANDDDAVTMNLTPGNDVVNIGTKTLAGSLTINGNTGTNQFNVQSVSGPTAINTQGGQNTFNASSQAPNANGTLGGIKAVLTLNGSGGADTANVDDTGDTSVRTGTLTESTLTGLGMAGITFSGLAILNLALGSGGNSFSINVSSGANLPATTTINGGSSNNDSLNAAWAQDFNGTLNLLGFEKATININRDFNGTMSDTAPGTVQLVTISQALTTPGKLLAGSIDTMTIGPDQLVPGDDLAGQLIVTGTLTRLRVAGGTPGNITAGQVGTVSVYGGYGPYVLQILENGIQRRVEAAIPGQDYPLLHYPQPQPPVNSLPTMTLQYIYESASLDNPQWTARVTNTNSARDQFDLSLVVYSDTAKFNLARLDAAGVSGVRNVAIEGDLLTTVTATANNFLNDTNPAGVQLPQDALAGVGIRDNVTAGTVRAGSLMGVAFGSLTLGGVTKPANAANHVDAETIPTSTTLIVQANDTFRVPFAADPKAPLVTWFFASNNNGKNFDNKNVFFIDQGLADARGAVTALITVNTAVLQTLALRGDYGALVTQQPIASAITSTGPMGDLFLSAPNGLGANVTATGFWTSGPTGGNISVSNGPISGTIRTTGLRTDPITGVTAPANGDLGRAFFDANGNISGVTLVNTGGGGLAATGKILVQGNLVSQVRLQSGLDGVVATDGDIGVIQTKNGQAVLNLDGSLKRFGGLIVTTGGLNGQVVALGNAFGDISVTGGVGQKSRGRLAVRGNPGEFGLAASRYGILGNLTIKGDIGTPGALSLQSGAIISGGLLADINGGTRLNYSGTDYGLLAAVGSISYGLIGSIPNSAGTFANATGANLAAINAIFTDNGGLLDVIDATQLGLILTDLLALTAMTGQLKGTNP